MWPFKKKSIKKDKIKDIEKRLCLLEKEMFTQKEVNDLIATQKRKNKNVAI